MTKVSRSEPASKPDSQWVSGERIDSQFADERLAKRFSQLLEQIAHSPGGSIPFACQDWASSLATEMKIGLALINFEDSRKSSCMLKDIKAKVGWLNKRARSRSVYLRQFAKCPVSLLSYYFRMLTF
jgi:Transposase DNA-binding